MNAAVLALCVFALFAVGYRFYARFLSQRLFALAEDEPVPARTFEDGIDYVPTRKDVLWGHHFTSIAGAAPIVGPAIAVIWGWVPALLWVAIGTVMMGAVHDFSALVISLRNRGRSIGEIAGHVISPRVRTLFLLIVSLLIWIVLAVFAFIIGTLFTQYPGAIFPINVQIIVAMGLGWLVYKRGYAILSPSIVAYAVLLASVFYGNDFAEAFPAVKSVTVTGWVWILLLYSFVASVLPVWLLLQPRDYLNAHQLITGLTLLTLGLIVLQPAIVAPAINPNPAGAPPMIPFLFITIACGAISGFHGLVASGTTSKQVGCATDAKMIGYGGMLGEGSLGMLAVLASTAGFVTFEDWSAHYASWGAANGLGAKLAAFVDGGARFVASLGIPAETAATFIAVMVIAFAATSLDTGARIQRLVISELAEAYAGRRPGRAVAGLGIVAALVAFWALGQQTPAVAWLGRLMIVLAVVSVARGYEPLRNRFIAGALGVSAALLLAVTQAGGQGGMILWPLFGTTNQLVAGVTLLVVSVWLRKQGKPVAYTLVPMLLVGLATVVAMTGEVIGYYQAFSERWLLALSGSTILVLDVWVLLEGMKVLLASAPTGEAAQAA